MRSETISNIYIFTMHLIIGMVIVTKFQIILYQVPVQRVTKYPLLLARLYKVTPYQNEDRPNIKKAKERIESALEQMNKVSPKNLQK